MRALKLASIRGVTVFVLSALVSPSGGQEVTRQAPTIFVRLDSRASDVTPYILLSENAYIFAVEKDLNEQVQVLYPASPGNWDKASVHRQVRLPTFFPGFSLSTIGQTRYVGWQGTVLVLASRAPFNLNLVSSGGDWNTSAVSKLIKGRGPWAGIYALASYLGAKGEPIGRDVATFGP